MIRAIIFDYGNVIARFDHRIFFKRIAKFSSLPHEDLFGAVREEPNIIMEYESGRLTSDDFFEGACQRLRLAMPKEVFREIFVDIFERIPTTLQLIRELKPIYKIGLLSNTNEWHYQAEIATILSLFDAVTLSYNVGAMKPSERIYRDVLMKLECEPSECVYIDDIVEYVEAAQRLGFKGVHYVSHEVLLSSMRENGVIVNQNAGYVGVKKRSDSLRNGAL